jgi:hypothetical protein
VAELRRCAQGQLPDIAAARAGLTLARCNEQTAGQANRLKPLKRQMHGRAGFVLLRQRLLHGAQRPGNGAIDTPEWGRRGGHDHHRGSPWLLIGESLPGSDLRQETTWDKGDVVRLCVTPA